ncbi:MAG: transposase, partial [Verrucomicrobiales bacterium]|nr:transposase [Verrucomicrobiales bacterium]
AISPEGTLRFMVTERRMNSELFCEFLDRLMYGESGHVLLIVDGHPAHRAKATKEHLAKFDGRLHLYLLPGYSPELNPDEHVWNWIKNHEIGRKLPKNKSDLVSMAHKGLDSLQRRTETPRGFFHDPHLKYIKLEYFCTA